MRRTRAALLIFALAAALAARAACAPADAVAGPALLDALAARIAGRPAMVVNPPAADLPPFGDGNGTEDVLKALGAAWFEPKRPPLAPLRAGSLYVLAPVTRDEATADFSGLSVLDATGRVGLWTEAIAALTPDDVAALGSEDGLVASNLPADARERLRRALRPPTMVLKPSAGDTPADMALLDTPADLETVRIRARLRQAPPVLSARDANHATSTPLVPYADPNPADPKLLAATGDRSFTASVWLPAVRRVPNTLKPSDLRSADFRRPVGVSGPRTLSALLLQLETVTGLRLAASAQYAGVPVVLGSPDIPAGEVMDGLCLALTASWRHVGGLYLLTWDRRGLGALQERAREQGRALTASASKAVDAAASSAIWPEIVSSIPFAGDDPFALSDSQRKTEFGPGARESVEGGIPYPDMTPGQQEATRRLVVGEPISVPTLEARPSERRAGVEGDLSSAVLPYGVTVEFEVRLPDFGWVRPPRAWYHKFSIGWIAGIRAAARMRPAPVAADVSVAAPEPMQFTLSPARRRGILTPVLSRAELEPLADLMKARGFRLLYYPLLTGGKATIPTDAFPPHPALGARAGWTDARQVMAARGATVVGYLETIAWRKPGETGHWLNQHADWLDRDVLGRTFSDAIAGQFNFPRHAAGKVVGDIVRSNSPEVARRLETLVRDFAAVPGSGDILFDAWNGPTALMRQGFPAPDFSPQWRLARGFAIPDRLAAIRRESVDPVDRDDPWSGELKPTDALAAPAGGRGYADGITEADRALLARLAAIRPAKGREWRTAAVAEWPREGGGDVGLPPEPSKPPVLPVDTTVTIVDSPRAWDGASSALFRVMPVPPAFLGGATDATTPLIVLGESIFAYARREGPLDLAIYDFRAVPGELLDSLRRVGLPPDPPRVD
jgi:hypothetical protein